MWGKPVGIQPDHPSLQVPLEPNVALMEALHAVDARRLDTFASLHTGSLGNINLIIRDMKACVKKLPQVRVVIFFSCVYSFPASVLSRLNSLTYFFHSPSHTHTHTHTQANEQANDSSDSDDDSADSDDYKPGGSRNKFSKYAKNKEERDGFDPDAEQRALDSVQNNHREVYEQLTLWVEASLYSLDVGQKI